MRKNRLIITGALTLWLSILAWGQTKSQDSAGESAVKNLLTDFLSAMKAKEIHVIQQVFHADAVMPTALAEGGFASLGHASITEFITWVGDSKAVLDEHILSTQIKIDGNVAHAWTPYKFYIEGKISHCGVNSFQLLHTKEGWKIIHIIDTRRNDGCN